MLKQLFPATPSVIQMTPKGEVPAFKIRESEALRPEWKHRPDQELKAEVDSGNVTRTENPRLRPSFSIGRQP